MKYEQKLVTRVAIALLLMIVPINIFLILKMPTVYVSYVPIKLLGYGISINGDLISIGGHSLKFIEACTATSAYYLLAVLILLTKDVGLKKSIKMFAAGTALIFLMNVLRVDISLVILMERGVNLFKTIHVFFWEVVSSVYVAAVWVFLVRKYKIKSMPVISDAKELYKKARRT